MKSNVLWITRTAVFVALLIVFQFATAFLNNTLITGSLVNLMLIIPTVTCGLASGLTVALLSPILAKFFGIGPLWELIPFIILGNISLVTVWFMAGINKRFQHIGKPPLRMLITAIAAAFVKFAVLYVFIVKLAVPVLLKLPDKQATAISAMFSFPQLVTALVGGGLTMLILPDLRKAITKPSS